MVGLPPRTRDPPAPDTIGLLGISDFVSLHATNLPENRGLDVHTVEPRPMPDRPASLSNVILTPHIAGGSRTGVLSEIEAILDNCRAALSEQPIEHQVTAAG
jgi:phosphoglycerate dehydrogenase-like enzyme